MGYLSSYLRSRGHATQIVELSKERAPGDLVRAFRPDAVGISVWCCGHIHALQCAALLARDFPDVIRIAGGPLASFVPGELLENDRFHYVIAGAGEIALSALLDRIESGVPQPGRGIRGVHFKGRDEDAGLGEEILDIENLPYPDRDPSAAFTFPNAILMNRGCNQRCIFCVNPTLSGVKRRSVDRVIAEIDSLLEATGEMNLMFIDDNIAIFEDQNAELCRRLRERGATRWLANIRADAEPETLDRMAAAGCTHIGVGVESGNDAVLAKIRKGVFLPRVEQTVARAVSAGMGVSLYYILGHYCDTPRTMQDTIDHAQRMHRQYGAVVKLGCNTPYPGSPQYVLRDRLGLTLHAKAWSEFDTSSPSVSARGFTLDDLREKYFIAMSNLLTGDGWVVLD